VDAACELRPSRSGAKPRRTVRTRGSSELLPGRTPAATHLQPHVLAWRRRRRLCAYLALLLGASPGAAATLNPLITAAARAGGVAVSETRSVATPGACPLSRCSWRAAPIADTRHSDSPSPGRGCTACGVAAVARRHLETDAQLVGVNGDVPRTCGAWRRGSGVSAARRRVGSGGICWRVAALRMGGFCRENHCRDTRCHLHRRAKPWRSLFAARHLAPGKTLHYRRPAATSGGAVGGRRGNQRQGVYLCAPRAARLNLQQRDSSSRGDIWRSAGHGALRANDGAVPEQDHASLLN